MPILEEKPEPFRRQTPGRMTQPPLSAEALNKVRDLPPTQIRGGKGINVSDYGDRVSLARSGPVAGLPDVNNYVTQFVVLQEFPDYLLCVPFQPKTDSHGNWIPQPYDKTLGQDSVAQLYVAKPYLLQKTPWGGKTVTINGVDTTYAYSSDLDKRTATTNSGVVTETYRPYAPGEVISAVALGDGLDGADSQLITWEDLNCGGRAWNALGKGWTGIELITSGILNPMNRNGTYVVMGSGNTYSTWIKSSDFAPNPSSPNSTDFFSSSNNGELVATYDGLYQIWFKMTTQTSSDILGNMLISLNGQGVDTFSSSLDFTLYQYMNHYCLLTKRYVAGTPISIIVQNNFTSIVGATSFNVLAPARAGLIYLGLP